VSHLLTGVDYGKTNQRTKHDRQKSFGYVKQYIYKDKKLFSAGMIFLLLGLTIDLGVPIYIGVVTDQIQQGST
jgi:hypothetical protein